MLYDNMEIPQVFLMEREKEKQNKLINCHIQTSQRISLKTNKLYH